MSSPLFKYLIHKYFWFLAIILFAGCLSNHYERTENFAFWWKIGDFEQAAMEVEKLAEKGPKKDRMLYSMEEGAVKRLQNDVEGSIRAFSIAGNDYEKWFGIHLNSQTKITEELRSTIGASESKPYKSRVYERVMIRLYQALNYLQTGKSGPARAEIFKIRQAINDSKQIWRMELESAKNLMKERSVNLDKGLNNQATNPLEKDLRRIREMIPSNLPNFVNPAAIYLESLYFLYHATERSDFDKARFSLQQLLAIDPKNPYLKDDFVQASENKISDVPVTYIFFETGRAPVRREKRYDFPLSLLSPTSRVPYLGLAFPTLVLNENFLSHLEVSFDSNQTIRTLPLANMDAIVANEFDKEFPIELSKAIAGSLTRGAVQYIATNALREESPIVQATGGVGIGMVAHGLTQSDCRSWTTLPKQIQFCKIPCGRSTELTLRGVETKLEKTVILKPATVNLVWVRSISAHTPLRIVNQFALRH